MLDVEDFHQKNTDEPITITMTFTELSEEAQKDFADYFRHGQLVVSAIANFDNATPKAEVKQYGQRLGVETFKPFFKVLGDNAKVSELKTLYETILVGLGSGLAIQYPRLDVCHARHRGYRRAIAGHVTVRGRAAEAKTPKSRHRWPQERWQEPPERWRCRWCPTISSGTQRFVAMTARCPDPVPTISRTGPV